MAAFWQKIVQYYLQMAKREQLLVLVSILAVIGFIWYSVVWDVIESTQEKYKAKIAIAKQEQKTFRDDIQIETMRLAKDPNDVIEKKQGQLKQDIEGLNKQLQIYSTQLLSASGLMSAIKDITEKLSGIEIKSVDILPDAAQEETEDTDHPLYQHGVQLIFQADYFATMAYLSEIEQLPWRLFWDKIDYKVIGYPKAEVTIELHTLSERSDDD